MSDEQRFDQATRDFYDDKIGVEEFHRIATETGNDVYAAMDAIDRIGQERIPSFGGTLLRLIPWALAGAALGLIVQEALP